MSLVVLSGAVRSGKSAAAERMAARRGAAVVVAAAGWDGDEEMERRIAAHRDARPDSWVTRVVGTDVAWVDEVPAESTLVLDCLATLVGAIAYEEAGDAEVATGAMEERADARVGRLVDALARRAGDTIVVTNEAGWGVVPASASGRLFRDLLGRANRTLVAAADAAYLVVAGRFIELTGLPVEPDWPAED